MCVFSQEHTLLVRQFEKFLRAQENDTSELDPDLILRSGHVIYTDFYHKPSIVAMTFDDDSDYEIHEAAFVSEANGTPLHTTIFADWSVGNPVSIWTLSEATVQKEKKKLKKKKKNVPKKKRKRDTSPVQVCRV